MHGMMSDMNLHTFSTYFWVQTNGVFDGEQQPD